MNKVGARRMVPFDASCSGGTEGAYRDYRAVLASQCNKMRLAATRLLLTQSQVRDVSNSLPKLHELRYLLALTEEMDMVQRFERTRPVAKTETNCQRFVFVNDSKKIFNKKKEGMDKSFVEERGI